MPASVRVESETGTAIVACSGMLRIDDARAAAKLLWAAPGWSGRLALWDFREAQFDLSSDEIRAIAKFILSNQPSPPPAKMAFVVARVVDYGMARMFEVFREDPRTAFRSFRDYDEGVAWLQSEEGGRGDGPPDPWHDLGD